MLYFKITPYPSFLLLPFPRYNKRFLCITFGLIAFILSASSASGCDYFTVVIPLLFYLKEPWRFSAGLFKYNLQTSAGWSLGCVAYPSETARQSQSLGLLDGGNISSSSSYTDAIKGVLSNDPSVKAASALVSMFHTQHILFASIFLTYMHSL